MTADRTSDEIAPMIELRTGSVGLNIAIELFGRDCIVDVGDWLTPARILIPRSDAGAYSELVSELTK